METKNVAVVLVASKDRSKSNLPQLSFYRDYFFNMISGIAAYWYEQTGGNVLIQGDVYDWVSFSTDPNFDDRSVAHSAGKTTAADAIKTGNNPAPLANYNFVIVVIAPPLVKDSAGNLVPRGIAAGSVVGGGILMSAQGDRFDFVAHEVGHQIGLQHSFDLSWNYYDKWAQQGEYGHTHCIMSAQSYGGRGIDSTPPQWAAGTAEYMGYGPGLSIATRCEKGWMLSTLITMPTPTQEVDLASGGGGAKSVPKAVRMAGSDGLTYYISLRSKSDRYDSVATEAVVIELATGGRASNIYPNTDAATIVWEIQLPLDYGSPMSTFSRAGFTVEVIDWISSQQVCKLRISKVYRPLQFEVTVEDPVDTAVDFAGAGEQHFAKGEVLCVEGTYAWKLVKKKQSVKIAASVDVATWIPTFSWSIAGQTLSTPSGSVAVNVRATLYPPIPYGQQSTRTARVAYEITGNNSLTLFNDPNDGNFEIDVTARVSTQVGAGQRAVAVAFQGLQLVMGSNFAEDQMRCRVELEVWRKKFNQPHLLLPGEIWQNRVTPDNVQQVREWLEVISATFERDASAVKQARAALSELLKFVDIPLVKLDRTTAGKPVGPPTVCTDRHNES
jgi:Metallo-peptidase family M12B Reprolysin-like